MSDILALREELAENGQPIEGVSAVEVHEFMLWKAKGCAITQEILNEMLSGSEYGHSDCR